MRERFAAILFAGFSICSAWAQAPTPPADDPLLDRFVGKWILEGSISGRPTTHDVSVDWALAHQYLRIHEVSRSKRLDARSVKAPRSPSSSRTRQEA